MSNADSAAMTVTVTQTPISWRRLGSVMLKNSRIGPAPSSWDASYSAGSILLMPTSSRTVQNPSSTQTPMTPTAGRAELKSPSQARAKLPRPTAERTWFDGTLVESTQLQAMPAATSGTTWGRNSTVRATTPIRPETNRRITVATTKPSTTGIAEK